MNHSNNVIVDLDASTEADGAESAPDSESGDPRLHSVIALLRECWIKRGAIAGFVAVGIVLSILYAFHLPLEYTSATSLMPPESNAGSSNLLSLLSSSASPVASAGSALLGAKSTGALFSGILESRTVRESLVARFGLLDRYKTHQLDIAATRLAANTNIRENPKSGIITITVKADSPAVAASLAQGYVEELNRVVTRNSTSAARRERLFLEERLKEIKQDLDSSSAALSQFSSKNKTIDLPSQGKAMMESGLKLEDQLIVAQAELAGLRQTYSEDNLRVRAAEARIGELQRQMNKELGSPEGIGQRAHDSAYPSFSELPTLGLTLAELERKTRVEEALWEGLTKQYEAAKVQEAKEIPTVRVLDEASIPQRKSAPARLSIVMTGAVLSLATACILVLARSSWQRMDPRDERKLLVAEIVQPAFVFQKGILQLPGMRWLSRRLNHSIPSTDATKA
jgi:uncharacterized protein involved in exopolysaccharide biosynthesis